MQMRFVFLSIVIVYGCEVVVVVFDVGLTFPERDKVVPELVNVKFKLSVFVHAIVALEYSEL